MEASVVVCWPLMPPRPCHPGNVPKVHKIAPKNKRLARGALRRAFVSLIDMYLLCVGQSLEPPGLDWILVSDTRILFFDMLL